MVFGIDASRAAVGRRTGTEAYAYHLIQSLIPLIVEAGHSLQLYFNARPPENFLPQNSNIRQVILPFPRLWTHLRLGWELRREPPDVFFTPSHVIPLGYFKPSVATIHDLGFLHFPETHTRRQVAYLRWSTRHNARRSRVVIVDSTTTRDDLIRFCRTEPTKIRVIYPGIDTNLKQITDSQKLQEVQRTYGIKPPYYLYIGTIQPRKNLARLIEAFANSDLSHRLVLAGGSGWLAKSIANALSRQPVAIQQKILLPGYIEEEDKAALISGASAVVFPSLFEGFGFPLVEANACGTPVLAANTSSLPEIAGDAALLVDPLDIQAISQGMQRLVTDVTLRTRLIAAGLENCRRFTWQKTAKAVLDALLIAAG